MKKEITFTNWVRIGDRRVALNDLTKEQQAQIAEYLIRKPLMTIANAEVIRSA